jgi:integrase
MLWEAWSFTRPFRTGRTINDAVDFILSLPESKQLLSSARQDTVDSAAIALQSHIAEHAEFGRDGLLFPARDGGHLAPSSLYGRAPTKTRGGWGFYGARVAAGRPDLRWHDLRHTGAVWAAAAGATLADLMARLGHSTQGAALRYQHAAQDRDAEIARRLSDLARR